MSKREAFRTGQPHQAAVAAWARKRLVDRGGAAFDDGTGHDAPAQIGCLFADGVGLGKTWEALATVALLLGKREWRRRKRRARKTRRRKQIRLRRRNAHVLILVPPGLVAKWRDEIRNPHGFQLKLERWARKRSRQFVVSTLAPEHCFAIRQRTDLDELPRGRLKRGRYVLPSGTYVCNWNVFLGPGGQGRDRVTALRNQQWDVVVVDEAHHGAARAALDRLRHESFRLLLSATPFQLDMTELHGLTKHLVEDKAPAHKVLKRGAVCDYAKAADRAFDGDGAPTPAQRRAAERVLGQLVAVSQIGRQQRQYFAVGATGTATPVDAPSTIERESDIARVLASGIEPSLAFQEWYLGERLSLARGDASGTPKHVAIELRKALAISKQAPSRPRLDALRAWARQQFDQDLEDSLTKGRPHKLLVFTFLKENVVEPVRRALEEELRAAYQRIARRPAWKAARARSERALATLMATIRPLVTARKRAGKKIERRLRDLERSIRGSVFFDLLGNRAYANRVTKELTELIGAEAVGDASADHDEEQLAWYAHQARTKRHAAMAVLGAVARSPLSATFTGDDTRSERDAIAQAFKTAMGPWILVATNVGSEGIDLHRYSRHLVHFDLEWNPARLEQREGRIDRLGRQLNEPARIYYLLVKDTYDERMFHQLIARQRWHSVLLGRKALQLDRDDELDARWISSRETSALSLDLDPEWSQRP